MRCAQIEQLRTCRSNVLENRHSVDIGRRCERKRLAGARRQTPALRAAEIEAADFSSPPLTVRLASPVPPRVRGRWATRTGLCDSARDQAISMR
jgi:hypothetical protein